MARRWEKCVGDTGRRVVNEGVSGIAGAKVVLVVAEDAKVVLHGCGGPSARGMGTLFDGATAVWGGINLFRVLSLLSCHRGLQNVRIRKEI